MLAESNLKLHKIVSNSQKVTEALPAEDRAKELKDLDLKSDDLPLQHILEVLWNMDTDIFKLSHEERPYTWIGVLATVNSFLDPFGICRAYIYLSKSSSP